MIKKVLVIFFAAFFISFILSAQEWEEKKKIGIGGYLQIVIDKNNNIHIAAAKSGGAGVLYKKSIDGGETWSADINFNPIPLLSSGEVAIAVDLNDKIYIIWAQQVNDYKWELYYSKSSDGGESWTQGQQLTNIAKFAHMPQIAIDSKNIIHVIWHVHPVSEDYWDEGDREYYYIKSIDGGETWIELKLLAWGFDHGRKSDMAVDSKDNIYAFWNLKLYNDENKWDLYCFKSKDGGESWTSSTVVGGIGTDEPSAAIDTNNTLHLCWHHSEYLYSRSIDEGENWSAPQELAPFYSGPVVIGNPPCLMADSADNLHLIYQNYVDGIIELFYKRSWDGGETWTPAEKLTSGIAHSCYPVMAMDSNLVIHAVWFQFGDPDVILYKRGLFTRPETPTELQGTAISTNQVNLTWQGGTSKKDGFKIERSLYADKEFNEVGFVLENIKSYTDTEFNAGTTCYYRVRACYGPAYSEYSNTASLTRSTIQLDRTQLYFGATTAGATTGSQRFLISNIGGGTLNWSVTTDKSWLNYTPSSGTSSGSVNVSVDAAGLSAGNYTGAINIEDPHASNSPQTVNVSLVVSGSGSTSLPFGSFETPVHGSTVQSSVPVTGWVLDDIEVESVKIYRESGKNLVYIGDAVFVEGARPDVEQAYPDYPLNYRAGWGYMMLTNFLPNGGNGTFNIHAIAADTEGHQVTLGIKTITCDNANAVKPFGAIDTPTQGGTASGSSFINWGWVLTPQPNSIPTDGSTIKVWINGINLGHSNYNIYREDIATLFPGYANSNGAAGYFYINTTSYENGVHTIQWTAVDDAGNTDGIGSRYFTIQNTGGDSQLSLVNSHRSLDNKRLSSIPFEYFEPVIVKKGFNRNAGSERIYPDNNGMITIDIKELERVEIQVFQERKGTRGLVPLSGCTGYLVVGNQLRSLPIGSTLDTKRGIFYWQPGPGFLGRYNLVFLESGPNGVMTKKNIFVEIVPQTANLKELQ